MGAWAGSFITDNTMFTYTWWVILLHGVCAIMVAFRLYFNPGKWGSVEIVSWTLNVGSSALFVAMQNLVVWTTNWSTWTWGLPLVFAAVGIALGLSSSLLGRSIPLCLSVICILQLIGWISVQASATIDDYATIVGLTTFGLLGSSIIIFAQWLQRSVLSAQLLVNLRVTLARICGSTDPAHFWSQTVQSQSSETIESAGAQGREVIA